MPTDVLTKKRSCVHGCRPRCSYASAVIVPAGVSRRTLIAVLQVLAIVFLAHGIMFPQSPAEVAQLMNAMLPRWFQVFLGVAEVLAAAGLTLPAVTGIMPQLCVLGGAGTMVVLGSACVLHTVRAGGAPPSPPQCSSQWRRS